PGHVRYLRAARALGDALAVAINTDESVRLLKGSGRPLAPEHDRAEIIASLDSVDYAIIFPEVRVTNLIEAVRPALYVKGGDYSVTSLDPEEQAAVKRVGAHAQILPFEVGYSTSKLIKKIKEL